MNDHFHGRIDQLESNGDRLREIEDLETILGKLKDPVQTASSL